MNKTERNDLAKNNKIANIKQKTEHNVKYIFQKIYL